MFEIETYSLEDRQWRGRIEKTVHEWRDELLEPRGDAPAGEPATADAATGYETDHRR